MAGLIVPHEGLLAERARSAFIAPNAISLGGVEVENASIWFGASLR